MNAMTLAGLSGAGANDQLSQITQPVPGDVDKVWTANADGTAGFKVGTGGGTPAELTSTAAEIDDAVEKRHSHAPVYTYEHTANKSAVVSAVNSTADTLTCTGHPFVNGDKVYVIMNLADVDSDYLPNVIIGGLAASTRYYVGVEDVNTIKLYSDVGRTSLINITDNANMNLTKIHLEAYSSDSVVITDLSGTRYLVHFRGREFKGMSSASLTTNVKGYVPEWINGTTLATYPLINFENVYSDLWIDLDCSSTPSITIKGLSVKTSSTSANGGAVKNAAFYCVNSNGGTITTLTLTLGGDCSLVNGTTLEVYKV